MEKDADKQVRANRLVFLQKSSKKKKEMGELKQYQPVPQKS